MTKRKATTASKPARRPKIAKAQRASPVIRQRSAAADNDPKHPAPIVESSARALQSSLKQTTEPELKGFDFSSATATARAYQAKLLEMAQANMQFALEFAQKLAAIRSPLELLRVLEELTNERIAMFRKYSSELVELSMKR